MSSARIRQEVKGFLCCFLYVYVFINLFVMYDAMHYNVHYGQFMLHACVKSQWSNSMDTRPISDLSDNTVLSLATPGAGGRR